MSKPRLYQLHYAGMYEWEWICRDHSEKFYAERWEDAYSSMMGHVCMHHPAPVVECPHEFGWFSSGSPGDHRCMDCGAQLPPVGETCS